jgi:hypothetical protein
LRRVAEDVRKVHRWLLRLPQAVYWLIVAFNVGAFFMALALMLARIPRMGPAAVWLLDMAVLAAFWVSHARYRSRHSRGHDPWR